MHDLMTSSQAMAHLDQFYCFQVNKNTSASYITSKNVHYVHYKMAEIQPMKT